MKEKLNNSSCTFDLQWPNGNEKASYCERRYTLYWYDS